MSWRAGLTRFAISCIMVVLVSATTIIVSAMASATTTIGQGSPTTGTIDVIGSNNFSSALEPTTGTYTGTVTFVASPNVSTPSPGIELNNSGNEIVTTGTLAVGSYSLSGTDSDASNDTGTWNYTLTVTSDQISQESPTSGTTTIANSASFADSLNATPGFTDTIAYDPIEPSTPAGLEVSSSGAVTTSGTLAATTYTIMGTDTDADGDSGTWSYALSVNPAVIAQGAPTSASTSAANSGAFTSTLTATSGFVGAVTFATSTPGFEILNGDELETTGPLVASSTPYSITGTDSDADGDGGTWSFSLTVTASLHKTTLTQTSSTGGIVVTTSSGTFSAGPITVENNAGPVTFLVTEPNDDLAVSPAGVITTTKSLDVGS